MDTLQTILLVAPVLLFSVIAHEVAHGYAALSQGDPTAQSLGRLSWNPVRHIDPFMTLLMPVMMLVASGGSFVLGGAKPVPVDPSRFRNYRSGDLIVSLAGVFTNFVIAFACIPLIWAVGAIGRAMPAAEPSAAIVQGMLVIAVQLNWVLIAFNLIPIPPLDGSHVVQQLLPRRLAHYYVRVGRFGLLILIAILLYGGGFLAWWMRPAMRAAGTMLSWVRDARLPGLPLLFS
ncbi:MAG: site-2 protease family protein [Gemmatimonadaceae bacterium]|nr:site-2 protease family protein [Gemmatimonadaceae bacterium]